MARCTISLAILLLITGCSTVHREASEPLVRLDTGDVARTILPIRTRGLISDVVYWPEHKGRQSCFIMSGNRLAGAYSSELVPLHQVDFDEKEWWKRGTERDITWGMFETVVVDSDADSQPEFFAWRTFYAGNPFLCDADGNLRWAMYEPLTAMKPYRGSWGDVDGDADQEFCIQTIGASPQFTLLDHKGVHLWDKDLGPEDKTPVRLLGPQMPDIDSDGKADIIVCDCKNIYVYDAKGDLKRTIQIAHASGLTGDYMRVVCNLIGNEDYIIAFDTTKGWFFIPFADNGQWIDAHSVAPTTFGPVISRFAALRQGQSFLVNTAPPTRADLHIPGYDTSGRLNIFNNSGELIYYELLPRRAASICIVPHFDKSREDFVVVSGGKFYRYSAKR